MKISKLSIKNFKTIKKIDINFQRDISLIVGKNNIGKSNVLKALGLFFENLNAYENRKAIFQPEDFRKNTVSLKIEVTFTGIRKLIDQLRQEKFEECSKKRSNQEKIRTYEQNINVLELYCNRKDEISITLSINRDGNKTITPLNYTEVSFEKYKERTLNMHFVQFLQKRGEKDLQNSIKDFQQNNTSNWFEYNWILKEDIDTDNGTFKYSLNLNDNSTIEENEELLEFKAESKFYNNDLKNVSNKIIQFVNERQRFLYIPAYRGGEKERNVAIEKLFDLIIDDLADGKGVTKEYDTVTDAIWGTGKNNNIYNLNRVVKGRLDKLVDNIKNESISTINEIKFKSLPRNQIRRLILKTMLGTSNIILDDGIETSYESKGTGIQSSFMISLLKSLSQLQFSKSLNIILVIEEPEAFTHPQLTREIMDKMCKQNDETFFQFIVTTHSPVIVNLVDGLKIQRLAEKNTSNIKETINCTNGKRLTKDDWNLINRICDINISEVVFADFVVFVEGEGDVAIFSRLLKTCLPSLFNRISIISISGNNQIFKLQKLLKYYDIDWILIADKDSFIDKRIEDKELTTQNLLDFFTNYQIGKEYQEQYQTVLNNPAIEKIIISTQNAENLGYGSLLKKLNELSDNITSDIKTELFGIISEKVTSEFIPYIEAVDITNRFNTKLIDYNVGLFSLPGDLESFIVNNATFDYASEIFKEYYPEAYKSYINETLHYENEAKIRDLQKKIGSKRFTLSKVPNRAKDRKKPHIPIEIISKYYETVNPDKEQILNDFKEIKILIEIIENRLKPSR